MIDLSIEPEELVKEAESALREVGPKTNEDLIQLAQAYALIAIAKAINSVIGQTASGSTKWIETYDNKSGGQL